MLNIWVAPRIAIRPRRGALTDEKVRPIRSYFWSPDSSMVLYVNDQGGDENFQLYGVDVPSGAARTLTPFDKTRVEIFEVSRSGHATASWSALNNRDPHWHDVYSPRPEPAAR